MTPLKRASHVNKTNLVPLYELGIGEFGVVKDNYSRDGAIVYRCSNGEIEILTSLIGGDCVAKALTMTNQEHNKTVMIERILDGEITIKIGSSNSKK